MEKRLLKKLHNEEQMVLDEIVRVCENNNLKYILIGGTLLGSIRHNGFIPWDDDLDIAMPREDYEKFIAIAPKELREGFILDDISTNDCYWMVFSKVRLKHTLLIEESVTDDYKKENGIWVDIFPLDYTSHFKDSFIKLKWARIRFLKSIYIGKSPFFKRNSHPKAELFLPLYKRYSMAQINSKLKKLMTSENHKTNKYFINYGSKYGVLRQTHEYSKVFPAKKGLFEGKEYCIPNDPDHVLSNIYGPNYMQLPPESKRKTHNPKCVRFLDGEEVHFNE